MIPTLSPIQRNRTRPGKPECPECHHPSGHWTTCHSPDAFDQDRADAAALELRGQLARPASYRPLADALARATKTEIV